MSLGWFPSLFFFCFRFWVVLWTGNKVRIKSIPGSLCCFVFVCACVTHLRAFVGQQSFQLPGLRDDDYRALSSFLIVAGLLFCSSFYIFSSLPPLPPFASFSLIHSFFLPLSFHFPITFSLLYLLSFISALFSPRLSFLCRSIFICHQAWQRTPIFSTNLMY